MRHALVVIAVLVLAGCGGSSPTGSDDSYAENLAAALGGVQQPAALDSAGLSALAADYGEAAGRLGRLTAPDAIADPHARMVASMRTYADDLGRASQVTQDPVRFASEMSQAQLDARAWTTAFEEIKAEGDATFSPS
jgi:hypothetical protein